MTVKFKVLNNGVRKEVSAVAFDYSKLKGRIIEKCGSQRKFAELFEISERSLSLKLNNEVPFKQPEINRACVILDIPIIEIPYYFFTPVVQ